MTVFLWFIFVLSILTMFSGRIDASFSGYVLWVVLILLTAVSAGCLFGDLLTYIPFLNK